MITLERKYALRASEDAGLEEGHLVEGYSGRGMYGAECFGVVGSAADAAKFLVAYGSHDLDAAFDLADALEGDQFGRSGIYYFPGYELGSEEGGA